MSQKKEEIKGYMLFDHNGVLQDSFPASEFDFVFSEFNYCRNGGLIYPLLYELDLNGYKTVYMSGNIEIDQVILKNLHEHKCNVSGVKYPPVYAMAVKDKRKGSEFAGFRSDNPKVIRDRDHGVIVAGTDDDSSNGKKYLRDALDAALTITEEQRNNSIVFDDGPPNVRAAKDEGYQVFRVGGALKEHEMGDGPAVLGGELLDGVQAFYNQSMRAVVEAGEIWITKPPEHEGRDLTAWFPGDVKKVLENLQWTAHPPLREHDIVNAFWYIREIFPKLDGLRPSDDVGRALMHLAIYSEKLPDGVKKDDLKVFLNNLDGGDDLGQKIETALTNNNLIRNTRFGFYKFFHSGPKHIENPYKNNRWARSTTEELLINLDTAYKKENPVAEPDNSLEI